MKCRNSAENKNLKVVKTKSRRIMTHQDLQFVLIKTQDLLKIKKQKGLIRLLKY